MKLAGEQRVKLSDPDFFGYIFLLAESIVEVNQNRLRYCLGDLIPIMIFVVKNQEFLDADVDIYGDFNGVVNRIFHMKDEVETMGVQAAMPVIHDDLPENVWNHPEYPNLEPDCPHDYFFGKNCCNFVDFLLIDNRMYVLFQMMYLPPVPFSYYMVCVLDAIEKKKISLIDFKSEFYLDAVLDLLKDRFLAKDIYNLESIRAVLLKIREQLKIGDLNHTHDAGEMKAILENIRFLVD